MQPQGVHQNPTPCQRQSFVIAEGSGVPYSFEQMAHDLIVYEFSRYKVERGDFSHFLEQFATDKLPTGRRLREMMNGMVFVIQGYDQDEREIHSIPEVRDFYRAVHEHWPYWLYFSNLEDDHLKMILFCCMDSFIAIKRDGQSEVKVEFDVTELLAILSRDFLHMNLICERAEMFEDRIEQRTKAIFDYFGLPYQI